MLYYIYTLYGPLKRHVFPLTPGHYFLSLYKKEPYKKDEHSITLYIPCDNEEMETLYSITLDKQDTKNNKYKIEKSKITKDIGKEFPLNLETPIYHNDIPIFLLSKNNKFILPIKYFKKRSKTLNIIKLILFTFSIIFAIIAIFLMTTKTNNPVSTPPETVTDATNFIGFNGIDGYYCTYDDLFPQWEKEHHTKSKYIYINLNKITKMINDKDISNIIINDDKKPTIKFLYHNKHQEDVMIDKIKKAFTPYCQPNILSISLPEIISDVNKFPFSSSIGYTIQEQKNKITFIFDKQLDKESKDNLDKYIKKQTSLFGRKFIFFHEKIDNSELNSKGTLQEEKGYIFINNQHRYFPQGL